MYIVNKITRILINISSEILFNFCKFFFLRQNEDPIFIKNGITYLSDPFKYRKDSYNIKDRFIRMFGCFRGEVCNKNTSHPLSTESLHSFVERSLILSKFHGSLLSLVYLFLSSKTHRLAISWRGMERKRKEAKKKEREREREGKERQRKVGRKGRRVVTAW